MFFFTVLPLGLRDMDLEWGTQGEQESTEQGSNGAQLYSGVVSKLMRLYMSVPK